MIFWCTYHIWYWYTRYTPVLFFLGCYQKLRDCWTISWVSSWTKTHGLRARQADVKSWIHIKSYQQRGQAQLSQITTSQTFSVPQASDFASCSPSCPQIRHDQYCVLVRRGDILTAQLEVAIIEAMFWILWMTWHRGAGSRLRDSVLVCFRWRESNSFGKSLQPGSSKIKDGM